MKTYSYKVRDKNGMESTGVVDALDERQAAIILKGKGLYVTLLQEYDPVNLQTLFASFNKPTSEDITNFTRQFSTMISSGLPLAEALRILKGQSKPVMKSIIEKILTEVEGGTSLADAISGSDGGFSAVYIAMVRAGESAGVLDNVMGKLAESMEKQREFRSKTKGALIYPIIIMVAMVVIATIMMIFVVPRLTAMYKDFGAELPGPTKALMSVSEFAVNYWYMVFVVIFGVWYGLFRWSKTDVGALVVEQIVFKVPIWGNLKKDIVLTEFTRTVGVLLGAGIPILDALQIVSGTLGSVFFAMQIKQAYTYVEKGLGLSEAIVRLEGFPQIVSQMVAVGEETGKLDDILSKLSKYYESESETKIKALTTAIEPLIMIIMGIGVGFLVIAVIMPIYNLTSQF